MTPNEGLSIQEARDLIHNKNQCTGLYGAYVIFIMSTAILQYIYRLQRPSVDHRFNGSLVLTPPCPTDSKALENPQKYLVDG
jgi:hypothetical protein